MTSDQSHGGAVLVEQLRLHGVERVFSVPGESFLAVLDGLLDSGITNIICRHEGAAAMMAEATGKLTGRPGIALVTRGPGAANASSGVHVARQDSTPMILLVGQIARGDRDREAFQEVDYRQFLGGLAKWVAQIDDPARIPEYVNRAFHVAMSGRPGPVVLALPEDVLSAPCSAPALPPTAPTHAVLADAAAAAFAERLGRAKRPLVIAGGSRWSAAAARDLAAFAAGFELPVAVSFRRQDHLDNDRPHYVGDLGVGMNPALAGRLREADMLAVIGARLGDIATGGYQLVDPAAPGKSILHLHPDPDLPGSVYRADMALCGDPVEFVAALARLKGPAAPGWATWTRAARADYERWQVLQPTPGRVRLEEVIAQLAASLPRDAILTNGAGNYAAFLHRYFRFHDYGTQLAPTSGSMGYGFPAALAAKLAHPGREVICLAGDGCFQMTLNELSTARQFGANVIVIVANNGRYGTIRMHQERHFPGRVSGTELANPDFAALASAYGGHGERVEATADFLPALARARASGRPAVIELVLDPDMLTTGQSLTDMRRAAGHA